MYVGSQILLAWSPQDIGTETVFSIGPNGPVASPGNKSFLLQHSIIESHQFSTVQSIGGFPPPGLGRVGNFKSKTVWQLIQQVRNRLWLVEHFGKRRDNVFLIFQSVQTCPSKI